MWKTATRVKEWNDRSWKHRNRHKTDTSHRKTLQTDTWNSHMKHRPKPTIKTDTQTVWTDIWQRQAEVTDTHETDRQTNEKYWTQRHQADTQRMTKKNKIQIQHGQTDSYWHKHRQTQAQTRTWTQPQGSQPRPQPQMLTKPTNKPTKHVYRLRLARCSLPPSSRKAKREPEVNIWNGRGIFILSVVRIQCPYPLVGRCTYKKAT